MVELKITLQEDQMNQPKAYGGKYFYLRKMDIKFLLTEKEVGPQRLSDRNLIYEDSRMIQGSKPSMCHCNACACTDPQHTNDFYIQYI